MSNFDPTPDESGAIGDVDLGEFNPNWRNEQLDEQRRNAALHFASQVADIGSVEKLISGAVKIEAYLKEGTNGVDTP